MNWPEGSGKAVHEAAQALKGDLKGDARLPAGQAQEAVAGLLMAVVDYARSLDVNAELALREALRLREKRSGSA
jgi:NTP pyrophosphatase (non-canonical NTP hydrolase)